MFGPKQSTMYSYLILSILNNTVVDISRIFLLHYHQAGLLSFYSRPKFEFASILQILKQKVPFYVKL